MVIEGVDRYRVVEPMFEAIRIVLGMDSGQLSAEWHASIRKAYAGFLERQSPPSTFGRVIIDKTRGGGELNIAPADLLRFFAATGHTPRWLDFPL